MIGPLWRVGFELSSMWNGRSGKGAGTDLLLHSCIPKMQKIFDAKSIYSLSEQTSITADQLLVILADGLEHDPDSPGLLLRRGAWTHLKRMLFPGKRAGTNLIGVSCRCF